MASSARSRALLPIAGGLAVLLAFGYELWRHHFAADDAFISFRYARHLVDGLGLVWNPGEPVEGYTNFLWVLIVAAGMAAGVSPEILAPTLGALSGLAILVLVAWLGADRHGWRDPFVWLVPAVLALNRSFGAWSTSGLETQSFSLLVLAGYAALLRGRRRAEDLGRGSSLLLAAATLTRPEGALFAGVAGVVLLVERLRSRRPLRPLVAWSVPYLLIVGAHLLWRHAYYGYWLPNSFHAKVNGLWWSQGLRYLGLFLDSYSLHWFLPLAALPLVVRRDLAASLFGLATFLFLAYVVAVGGDYLEYRFLVPVLPYLTWLVADGMRILSELQGGRERLRTLPRLSAAALGLGLVLAVAAGSASSESEDIAPDVAGIGRHARFTAFRIEQGRALRDLIERGVLPRELRIQVGAAGALPYYTDWYALDMRGINDVRIAREPLEKRGLIGHERRASLDYTLERRVAVIPLLHQLLFEAGSEWLSQAQEHGEHWVRAANRELGGRGALRMVCLEIELGAALLFATPLGEEALASAVGSFPPC